MTTTEQIDYAATLCELNTEAKALSRRGWVGMRTPRYTVVHANIDLILTALLDECALTRLPVAAHTTAESEPPA